MCREFEPGEDFTELPPAKAGLGGARSSEDGPFQDPVEDDMDGVGIAICDGLGAFLLPILLAGRQICSPRVDSGMESEHEEQVTEGSTTEARSISCGRVANMLYRDQGDW